MTDTPKPKKPGRPRKATRKEEHIVTEEFRRYLLDKPVWTLEEVEQKGTPNICWSCNHARIIRYFARDGKGTWSNEEILCGKQHNRAVEFEVMTCEMYELIEGAE